MWEKFDEEKAFETTSLKQSDKGVLFPIMIVDTGRKNGFA